VAYGVSQRKPEIAVRIALGATSRDILSLILRDPVRTTLAGIVVGTPASYLLMRSASSLLFGVRPFDPVALLLCAGVLSAATLAAALWPALRATRIDPAATFRSL
jgi:ABC-type antimicrobial peptide transport system permease subunit